MKKLNFRNLLLTAAAIGVTTFYSCGEEEKTPAPVADFTVSVSGKAITIVNTSTDAETYAWDFGDGGTSAEMTPTHTYDANGSYVVKLTVTNESGEDDKSAAVEIINITIDGTVSDWADVPAIVNYTDGEGGSIKTIKVENLQDDKLFFYIKTTSSSFSFVDLYLNTDNEASTGFASWLYPTTYGTDILFEGYIVTPTEESAPFVGSYDNATAGDDHTAWAWTQLTPSATFLSTHSVSGSGDKEIEFSIAISELPAGLVAGGAIKFFIVDVDPVSWSWLGNAPAPYGEEASAAFSYTLKQ